MLRCWEYKARDRPTFCEIIEELIPDLDESFRDLSFFFSDLNMHSEDGEDGAAAGTSSPVNPHDELSDSEGERDDDTVGVTTPLHRAERLNNPAGGHHNSEGQALDSYPGEADLDSSHSSLSYDSHSRHSPTSSPRNNQNSMLAYDNSSAPPPPLLYSGGRAAGGRGAGEPSDSNVIQNYNTNSIRQPAMLSSPPPTMLQHSRDSDSSKYHQQTQEKWSPDSNSLPPHSNEGSKGSSKSSGSGNGLNGIANGHIPRIIVPNPQC